MLVAQLCLTLCEPIGCTLIGSSVHANLQAGIPEWVAIPFSKRSSQPKDQTWGSCTAGGFFTMWATGSLDMNTSPGKCHRQRSLVGYSPWGHKESDTEWATSLHDTWRGPSSQIRFIYHTYISQLHWLLISSHYQPCKSWSTSLSTAKGSTEVWWSWRNTLDSNSWISFFLISHSVTSDSLRPHGILQARTLEWVAFPFSRGSSQPRDQTQVSRIACGFFTSWATREALDFCIYILRKSENFFQILIHVLILDDLGKLECSCL